jgi:hypothetical protein
VSSRSAWRNLRFEKLVEAVLCAASRGARRNRVTIAPAAGPQPFMLRRKHITISTPLTTNTMTSLQNFFEEELIREEQRQLSQCDRPANFSAPGVVSSLVKDARNMSPLSLKADYRGRSRREAADRRNDGAK